MSSAKISQILPFEASPLPEHLQTIASLHEPDMRWDDVIVPRAVRRRALQMMSSDSRLTTACTTIGTRTSGVRSLLISGPSGVGRTSLAHGLAHRLDLSVLSIDGPGLIEMGALARVAIEDCLEVAARHGALCVVTAADDLVTRHWVRDVMSQRTGQLVLCIDAATEPLARVRDVMSECLELKAPGPMLREQLWEVHLPPGLALAEDVDVRALAAWPLTGAEIRRVTARAMAWGPSPLTMEALTSAVEREHGEQLPLADGPSLDALVLPEEQAREVREVIAACQARSHVMSAWGFGRQLSKGRGICVLLDGPPGTGKTFTAEVIAAELGLPLVRVQVPELVSKWAGETEKNIRNLFERARTRRSVLLFDEADTLFGRRASQATSAGDRQANSQVNQLLQELEGYDGVCVLTTNLYGGLDEALQRRVGYRVTFEFPEAAERARIWQALVPAEAPLSPEIDWEELGWRYELSGGHIKNALLRAAYRACSEGAPIGFEHLCDAARRESAACGKLVRE